MLGNPVFAFLRTNSLLFCKKIKNKKSLSARSHQYINPDDVQTEEEEAEEEEEEEEESEDEEEIELFKTSKKRMHLQRERKRRHNKARSKNSGKSQPISTTTPPSSIDGSETGSSPSPPLH